jgi:hypothetical protein
MDMIIKHVKVNNRKYKLQHPGNRAVLRLRAKCSNTSTGSIDLEPMMDYCFEYVVIPQGHSFKPGIDTIHPKEFEEWITLLPGFLRRGYVGEYSFTEETTEKCKEKSPA